jgi:hypothetical protein
MMNKLRVLLLTSVLAIGFSLPCFADQVQGFVESTDSSNNSIVIKDPVSGTGKTVRVHPKVLSQVKKGSVVKATFPSGSENVETFEVVVTR